MTNGNQPGQQPPPWPQASQPPQQGLPLQQPQRGQGQPPAANPLAEQRAGFPRTPQASVGNPLQGQAGPESARSSEYPQQNPLQPSAPVHASGRQRNPIANPGGQQSEPSARGGLLDPAAWQALNPFAGQPPHEQYPLGAELHADGTSSGPQADKEDVPWIVDTRLRPGEQIQRSTLWGLLTAVAAGLHLLIAAVGVVQAVVVDVHAFFAILPFWGILSLVVLAGVILCFLKRGSFNRWMAIIAAGTLVVSNPILPMAVVVMITG